MDFIILLIILVVLLYSLYIIRKTNDFFNPISTFIFPIFVGYIIFLVYYNDVNSISLIIYGIGVLAYFFGFLFHRGLKKYPLCYNYSIISRTIFINKKTEKIYQFISLIAILITISYISRNLFSGPFGNNIIRNLRYISLYVESKGFFAIYGLVVANTLLKIYIYKYFVEHDTTRKTWIIILAFASLLSLISTFARSTILSTVVSLYYIYSLKNKTVIKKSKIKFKNRIHERFKSLFLFIIVGLVFFGIAYSTAKLGSLNIFSKDFFLNKYMGQEIFNFDKYILNHKFEGGGYYCLGIIGKILASIGLIPNDIIVEIGINIGNPVYSFISGPYVDFGILGVFLFMFLMGIFHSFVYQKSLRYGGYWSIFYTTCIYSCIMSFYAFQYLMSDQVYLLLLILILQLSNYKLIIKK